MSNIDQRLVASSFRQHRVQLGIRLTHLAMMAGMDKSMLSRWERGLAKLSRPALQGLMDSLFELIKPPSMDKLELAMRSNAMLFREMLGLAQTPYALRMGVSQTRASEWEQGPWSVPEEFWRKARSVAKVRREELTSLQAVVESCTLYEDC